MTHRPPAGWEYRGELCRDPACRMLECPLLLPVPLLPGSDAATSGLGGRDGAEADGAPHLLCYSADYCANGGRGAGGTICDPG
jgi:hypothetical protein